MAFKLNREKTTAIEGVEINGKEISVVPSILKMGPEFNRRFNKLIIAEKQLKEIIKPEKFNSEDIDFVKLEQLQQAYGDAVIGILEFIFEAEGSAEILAYYEDNYIELLTMLQPYLLEIIVPALQAESERNRKRHAEMHKGKQKKRFGAR